MSEASHGPSEASHGPRSWLLLALALTAVAAVYGSALEAPFFWDDHLLIENEPRVRTLAPLASYFDRGYWSNPATQAVQGYFRPLTTLSFALDHRFWQGRPAGFHGTNLLLHLLCCTLVFGLCRRGGASPATAALAAALFGSFPRLTESATWVSGRTDLLAGLGALGALWLHDTRSGGGARRLAAASLLGLGLLGKEVAAAGAVAIVLLEWISRREDAGGWRRTALHLVPLAVVLAAYGALRWRAASGAPPGLAFGFGERPLLALQALGTYLVMLLDPLRPQLVIGRLGVAQPALVLLGAALAIAGAVGAGVALRRARAPLPLAAAGLGVVALLPVLHLIPLPLEVVAADRFLYLPVAALAVALGCASTQLGPRGRRLALGAALVALPAFLAATALRNAAWQDALGLWQIEAARAPRGSSTATRQLGTLLAWRGQPERALAHYRRAFAIEQEFAREHPGHRVERELIAGIALVLSELGRYDEALEIASGLVGEEPRHARYRGTLGAIHARNLDFDAAERELSEALRLHASYGDARRLLVQVRRARALWSALPPEPPAGEGPAEPPALRAQRATVHVLVGRLAEATRVWSGLLDEPVEPALARRAALFLVVQGDARSARRALERLQARGWPADDLRAMQDALQARFPGQAPGRGVPAAEAAAASSRLAAGR